MVLAQVRDQLGAECGEQGVGCVVGIEPRSSLVNKRANEEAIGRVGPRAKATARRAGLGHDQEVAVRFDQAQHPAPEGDEALDGGRPRAERWGAADDRLLEGGLMGGEHGSCQPRPIGEAAKEGSLADPRRPGNVIAQNHPEITFRSSRVELGEDGRADVEGELEIKGISRPVRATGTYQPPVEDPYGSVRTAIELSATVDRREWEMDWQMPLPKGGDVLGYEVELTVHLELIRQG